MKRYVTVQFDARNANAEIVTALLLTGDYEGLLENEQVVSVSVNEQLFEEPQLKKLMEEYGIAYSLKWVEPENWNAAWEKSFEPVAVEDFAIIRAGFHAAAPGFQYEIIITPKMSFGTGHHATTFLMIQQMRSINFHHKKVIDFGTGTGVLAILAEKLGASHVLATDIDEWSINNSLENIETNHCTKVETLLAEGFPPGEKADIILANINLNVILENLQIIHQSLNKGGKVLFSGLLTSDKTQVSGALEIHGFHIDHIAERNGWICILTSY